MNNVPEAPLSMLQPENTQKSAVICCIESGVLEAQVVRMAASLRKFGGLLSKVPIVAVRPRLGPPISNDTRRALERLQVELIEQQINREFAWQHYTNKAHAMLLAEDRVLANQYIWLDSDVVVLADPSEHLLLRAGEDFVASVPDRGSVGSSGPGDSNDELWGRACDVLGIDINTLPWVITYTEKCRIRFYLNSGVFSYRRQSRFARNYFEDCFGYLKARASKSHSEVHFCDQIVLGLCAHKMGLRWRLLPHSYNYACHSKLLHWVKAEELVATRILHYHDMMDWKNWRTFLAMIDAANHPRRRYFEELGPLVDPSSRASRGVGEVLRIVRGAERRKYYASCGFRK